METDRSLFYAHLAQTSRYPAGLEVEHAKGVYLFGPDGKRYLDLISGISVSSLGHCNAEVMQAVKDQVSRHMHLMVYGEYIQAPQVRLAGMLASVLPEDLDNVYFTNSGSEAVEGAMKLTKRYSGRSGLVSFRNAYHGHTQGALSLIGNENWKRRFRPLIPGITLLDFNAREQLREITRETAAIFIEPVQGEAGVVVPEPGFLEALRARCHETGTLLVFDEVQTGMGRTGALFAFQRFGVKPDILILAKALGAGMPLGAFIASREIMGSLADHPPLGHITTFGGHPVSCAAAVAGLKQLLEKKIPGEIPGKEQLLRDAFSRLNGVKEVRSCGLLMAVELPSEAAVKQVIEGSLSKGVITDWFLFRPTALRIAPPLVISKEELNFAAGVISEEIGKL